MNRALIFGAGNIGRGFLGVLLSKSDYEITFIDIHEKKINLINSEKQYPVFIVSSNGINEDIVKRINAICFNNQEEIIGSIVESDLILTAVGKESLAFVAPILAQGLIQRFKRRPNSDLSITVVACENVQDNTNYLYQLVMAYIPKEYINRFESLSFPNCVVDRIVPNVLPKGENDPLAVAVEDYFQFVVDSSGLKSSFPKIIGVEFSENLEGILEQKLCTLNMAHAVVAYYGYIRDCEFIHEAMNITEINKLLKGALAEVESMIASRHKYITLNSQRNYAEKVIKRFQNPHLKDEITRVARQPKRKLGQNDRLVKPAALVLNSGKIPCYLATGITAALRYNYPGDCQAVEIVQKIKKNGIRRVISEVTGLSQENELTRVLESSFIFRGL